MKTPMQKMIEILESNSYYIPMDVMIESEKLLKEEKEYLNHLQEQINWYKKLTQDSSPF